MSSVTRQRRERILTELYENGHVAVKSLAERLAVSEATVRRDLRVLSGEGRLELVYGGASLRRNADYSFRSKGIRNVEAKRIIGRLAAGLIRDDEQVFIDSGTTCFAMLPALKQKRGVSVITNSARLALELDTANASVIMLGGQYRPDRMDTTGPLATAALDQLRGYTAFIGADGLSMEFGLAAADVESAHLYGLAVRNAREAVLVADHTKFLSPSLCKIVDWELIARVVTDRPCLPAWSDFLRERDIETIHPEAGDCSEGDSLRTQ